MAEIIPTKFNMGDSIDRYTLTRRQILEIWSKQSDDKLDSLCCPSCRDILIKENDIYRCPNPECMVGMTNEDLIRIGGGK